MKKKTCWKVTVDNIGLTYAEYLVTAGNAESAAKRGLMVGRKDKRRSKISAPYVQKVECHGEINIF